MQTPRKKRGVIQGLSVSSGGRLWDNLTAVNPAHGDPLLITLTYPAEWPGSWEAWKSHLDNFRRAWVREFGRAGRAGESPQAGTARWGGAIWRLESQRRGAPHYHLLMWCSGIDLGYLRGWVSLTWYRIVGSNDPKHLQAGTRVELVKSTGQAFGYLCKYLGKDSVHPDSQVFKNPVGRYWGVWSKRTLLQSVEVREISRKTYTIVRRVIRKKRDSRRSTSRSKLRSKDCFNRVRIKHREMPGTKEFMAEEDSKKLVEYFDPVPF